MIDRLRELISIESYSGKEKPILEHIKIQLERDGIQPFFQEENLVVRLTGKDQTRAFIFNGHVDVVNIEEPKNWKYDPLAGRIAGGRIYGRGASDMKGGIWAMMETAKSLAKADNLPTDVWFTFVVREETDSQGTKQFADWFKGEGYLNRYRELAAIFAEPTSLDVVHYGHRGNFFIKAEKTGVAGHSSRPTTVRPHAILEMTEFISDLTQENLGWQKQFAKSEFVPPTITPTSIQAKSASPNMTADRCQANFDLRTIPGFHQEAYDRVKELADKRGIGLSLLHPPSPTGYTKPDARIVKVFKEILPDLRAEVNDASNDLGFFSELGIEGVMFGPGDMSQAHRTNESADVNQITTAPDIFEKVYLAWATK